MSTTVYPLTFFGGADVFVDEIFGMLRGVWKDGNHSAVIFRTYGNEIRVQMSDTTCVHLVYRLSQKQLTLKTPN